MSLADELLKLDQLRTSGSLTTAEFEQAKKKLLDSPTELPRFASDMQEKRKYLAELRDEGEDTLGRAANRYVSFQMTAFIVGIVIFLIMLFAVILPQTHRSSTFPGGFEKIEWKTGN